MLDWIRSLPVAKALGVFFTALLFGLAAAGVARARRKADTMARVAERTAASGATLSVERAAKATAKAEAHKQKAEVARTAAEARLDAIGASDDTLADLVSDWNSERLRG